MERHHLLRVVAAVLIVATTSVGMHTQPPQRGPIRGRIDEADTNATRDLIAHDIGNVRMTFSNWGEQGNPDGAPGFKGFEFPLGSGNDFLFSAGIWVGAKRNGVRLVSTATDGDNGTNEFWPEHIGSVPDQPADPDWHRSSTSLDSLDGRRYVRGARGVDDDGDWSAATDDLDNNGSPSYNWDGGNGWIGLDDDGDGFIDEEAANGADDDSDGLIDEDTDETGDANGDGNCYYDPEPHVDEDPPGDKSADWQDNDHDGLVDDADPDFDGDVVPGSFDDDGDGESDEDAAAWGYQEYFTVYQDSISGRYVNNPDPDGHTPLNIMVLQRTFAWSGSEVGDFIIAEYIVRNQGSVTVDSAYVGVFADPDIGAAGEGGDAASLDDYNYFDHSRLMMVQYDRLDDADGTGPGVFAVRVLRTPAPLESLRVTFRNYERVSGGDPETNANKYSVMSSGRIDPPTPQQGDWRMLMAFGRELGGGFTIAPGGELMLAVAFVGALDTATIGPTSDAAFYHYISSSSLQRPSPPGDFQLVETGSGFVQVAWRHPPHGNVAGYNLFGVDDAGHGSQQQFNTTLITDTVFAVTGLQNGSDWLLRLQAVNDSGLVSAFVELLVRVAAPRPITGLEGSTTVGIVTLAWQASPEPNVIGYRVLRRSEAGDSTSFAAADTTFVDSSAQRGYRTEYWVVAENDLGLISLSGSAVEFIPMSPQRRILLLNDTGPTQLQGGGLPLDSIRIFYLDLMNSLEEEYDYCEVSECGTLDTLVQHDVVIWINENRMTGPMLQREQTLSSYLLAGGRLLRIARHFMVTDIGYPRGMRRGSFAALSPLSMDSVYVSPATDLACMQFVGAVNTCTGFPSFTLDTNRLYTELLWGTRRHEFLPGVDIFWPRPPTSVLYRSMVGPTDSSGLHNQPCAVIDTSEVLLAFSLYFVDRQDAFLLLDACIDTLRGNSPDAIPQISDRGIPTATRLYPNYPNPFNPSTMLRFDLARSGNVKLAIYNLLGQEVRVLVDMPMSAGAHQMLWDGADRSGRILGSGIYFARLETTHGTQTQKLVMLK